MRHFTALLVAGGLVTGCPSSFAVATDDTDGTTGGSTTDVPDDPANDETTRAAPDGSTSTSTSTSTVGTTGDADTDGDSTTTEVLDTSDAGSSSATASTGPDVEPTCGNGIVDPDETCDPSVADSCPEMCDDRNPCTTDTLQDGGTCDAMCTATPLVGAADGDGCCAAGTNPADDDDCPDTCGDGTVDPWEACDLGIVAGEGACPTPADCTDDDACTADALDDEGTCTASCVSTDIIEPVSGDSCCPDGESSLTDDDCEPLSQCEPADVIVGSTFDPSSFLTAHGDHEGALWALWAEDGGSFDDIRAARLDPMNSTWAADVAVEATPDDVRALTAHLDHNGELWALWTEDGGISDAVRGSRLDPGTGTWQADVSVGSTFDQATEIVAGTDDAGALWALWVEAGDVADDIRAARLDPTSTSWQADIPVGSTFGDAQHLAAAADHEGALWSAWVESTGSVRAARLDSSSGSWSPEVTVGSSFDAIDDLVLSTDGDGALWAVWTDNGGIAAEVRAARLDPDSGTWQPDVVVQSSFDPLHDLVVRGDADGTLHAAWIEDGSITDSVRSARLDPGSGAWLADVEVGATFDQAASLVMGRASDDATWAIWAEFDGLEAVRASRLDPTTSIWAPDVAVQSTFDVPLEVATGTDASGELWALWIRDGPFDGSQVRATSCGFF